MTSQLNVDTIVDKAGSGGTNVKIANTSVTVSEGGSATTNTAQGLNKQWIAFNMDGTIGDSFNTSSISDVNAGDFNIFITNSYANIHYAMGVSGTNSSNGNAFVSMQGQTPLVNRYRLCGYLSNGTNLDLDQTKAITAGDLA